MQGNWYNLFFVNSSVLSVILKWFGNYKNSSKWFWQLFDFLNRTTGPVQLWNPVTGVDKCWASATTRDIPPKALNVCNTNRFNRFLMNTDKHFNQLWSFRLPSYNTFESNKTNSGPEPLSKSGIKHCHRLNRPKNWVILPNELVKHLERALNKQKSSPGDSQLAPNCENITVKLLPSF